MPNEKTVEEWVNGLSELLDRLQNASDKLRPFEVEIKAIEGRVFKKLLWRIFLIFLVNNLIFILYILLN